MRIFTRTFLAGMAITATSSLLAQPETIRQEHWWVANSPVRAIAPDAANDRAYIGGEFGELHPPTSTAYGCLIESNDEGWPVLGHVRPNNSVRAVVSDGSGGWYIGGDFTQVNGEPRLRIAHILANGGLDPNWTSGTDGIVRALALHEGKLYVGGDFSNANLLRNRVAAFHAVPGIPTTEANGYSNLVMEFNGTGHANNNQVRTLKASGGLLYVGGTFTNMGGATCNRLIALDATTGNATSWVPNVNGDVNTIALRGDNTALIGGSFTQVNSTARQRFAELEISNAALTTLNPGVNNTVWTLAISGDTLFVGGEFTTFNTQTRTRLAAMKLSPSPTLLDWNPAANNSVYSLLVSGTTVRIGGTFTSVNNSPAVTRYRLAEVDRIDGFATGWNPFASGSVLALAAYGSGIYAGGGYNVVGYRIRSRMAAIDLTSGRPTTFDPNVNSTVHDILLHNGTIYMGGQFTSVGGQTRNRAAAMDATGTLIALWQPNINNTVVTMAHDGVNLYLGGSFTTISGYTRNRIAALDLANGGVNPNWVPTADGDVYKIQMNNGLLYVGGDFTTIGNPAQPRQRIARFVPGSESPDTWNPGANGRVRAFAFKDNDERVFVGGHFTNIGGSTRQYLAALSVNGNGAAATGWECNANSYVYGLACSGNTLYVGGDFYSLGGTTRQGFASVRATTGAVFSTWYESMNGWVLPIVRVNGLLIAGGAFTQYVNGTSNSRPRLAAWAVDYEDETVGLATAAVEEGPLHIFPNPTSGLFTLALEGITVHTEATVFDAQGRQVGGTIRLDGADRHTFDLGNEADGLYILRIVGDAGVITRHVLVQH